MLVRLSILLIASLLYLSLGAQGHQPVFPELEGDELYDAVRENFTPASVLTYGAARDILFGTVYEQNNTLGCVYTGWEVPLPPGEDPTQAAFQNGMGLNTEHTYPQAKGASQEPARADMHHLYPTRVDVNGARGNLPFGEIPDNQTDSWFWQDQELSNAPGSNRDFYSELLENGFFEPREDHKGNVARAMFYFYTIYRAEAQAADANYFAPQRATLCQWHQQDPIDAQEWERTFLIAQYQDDKANPFVLDCTLAGRMYCPEIAGNNCISDVDNPTGNLAPIQVGDPTPNPSRNGLTAIPYSLTSSGRLTVSWYNVQGQRVRTRTKTLVPGDYELITTPDHPGTWLVHFLFDDGGQLYQHTLRLVVLP